jgi:hypothetical protein
MKKRIVAGGMVVLLLGVQMPSMSAVYSIENPADKIYNPAGKMYNPASDIKNPAATIYNPAANMDNPNPLSPVTPPVARQPDSVETTRTTEQIKTPPQFPTKVSILHKRYHFKTEKAYISAAKKAFNRNDYAEFVSIAEDALRRIDAGTLRASTKTKQMLVKYRKFGYGLMEKDTE